MLISSKIEQFYKDVENLDLRFPIAEIALKTGFAKSNVSDYLSKKKVPSDNFLKVFYEFFSYPLNEDENSNFVNEPDFPLEFEKPSININNLNSCLKRETELKKTIENLNLTIDFLKEKLYQKKDTQKQYG
ncbi:MAG: hypothetical protein ACEQSR_03815 [Candidatus Methylacidiphilales bacterium]